MCKDQQLLDHDSVYTKYTLEVDGTFGGCPSGSPHCTRYAACNPTDASGVTWDCRPKTSAVGMANCTERDSARKPGRTATKYVRNDLY